MEGSRELVRDVDFYNLYMVIAIGFRVRSSTGTKFRIWANEKLKEYITKGFVLRINQFQLKFRKKGVLYGGSYRYV